MKKIFTVLSLCNGIIWSFAQWSPTTMKGTKSKETKTANFYSLDLNSIRAKLTSAQPTGKNNKPIIVDLPTLGGKIEQFEVYSLPVVEKSLADRYQLGSYVGAKVGDPTVWVRFSVSPYDLQSMMFRDGKYEFIEPLNAEKTVYGVFPKTEKQNGELAFSCSTNESPISKNQINQLTKSSDFSNSVTDFSKASDKKYRTYRLAISVIGEYTQYFGGVPQAFAAINATVTRVNGVFEKDFAIHLDVQDFPQLIYTNPSTDPYSSANVGIGGAWNLELQQTLTSVIGNDAYDIGHLFGRAGGSGSAGDVGNVCRNPSSSTDAKSKGAAFSTPRSGGPEGESFDIDLVAHEMGHQFGADHTYSFDIQSAPNETAHMEPGSGSTIMGYAGISSGTSNVQNYTDSYFHSRSVEQVQIYINSQTCGTSNSIDNNPPVVTALANKTIPKGTAFVLTADATDAENNPLTYSWEEYDLAKTPVTTVIGNNTTGAKFRSFPASNLPYRFFPKLNTVIGGSLSNAADWESVSDVERTMDFRVLVRDNNPDVTQQQTAVGSQTITVGNDGPFKMTTAKVYNNVASPVTWDVVNTNAAPYNVSNVKIDYSTDQGLTWNVLTNSTPNDGSELFDFSAVTSNSQIVVRVSAVDNVFYALGKVAVSHVAACDGSAPTNLLAVNVTQTTATIDWDLVAGASYTLRYKKTSENNWTVVNNINTNHYDLSQLEINKSYDVNVAAVCSGTTGEFAQKTFFTSAYNYCAAASTYLFSEKISNVNFADINNSSTSNVGYEDFSNVVGNVTPGKSYSFTASSSTGSSDYDQVLVWIDLNQDGDFDDAGEKVLTSSYKTSPWTGVITIPASALAGRTKMRVRLYGAISNPNTTPCGDSYYGQVEDYTLNIGQLSASDVDKIAIQYYPNPVDEVLTVSSDRKINQISVYNVTGQLLQEVNDTNVINLSKLSSGVYFVKAIVEGKTETTKIIKK
ncbi:reprolysin-like metallopeptidase [Epilithonimonas arachidiradicis]|nr:zinc-dependent metalloprotease family protein [Epilithonimonas arachidiradicis]RKE86903.1 putative secreted protein (Por secretion system target) [Epilithonimonas arachidiradicis]